MALSQLLGGWTKWGWPRCLEQRVPGRLPADARRRRLDAGRAASRRTTGSGGTFGAGPATSGSTASGQLARVDDSGDRVRDRARLRAHVRHDRPAHPAQDEAGPGRRCAATYRPGCRRQRTSRRRTGAFASTTRTQPRRSRRGSRPSRCRNSQVRIVRGRIEAACSLPGGIPGPRAEADIRAMDAAEPQTRAPGAHPRALRSPRDETGGRRRRCGSATRSAKSSHGCS